MTNSTKIIHNYFINNSTSFILINGGRGDDREGMGEGMMITMVRYVGSQPPKYRFGGQPPNTDLGATPLNSLNLQAKFSISRDP